MRNSDYNMKYNNNYRLYYNKQEALLLERNHATRHVSKFVLCFRGRGVGKVSNSKSDLQA